jgi:HlyD family secretion protein
MKKSYLKCLAVLSLGCVIAAVILMLGGFGGREKIKPGRFETPAAALPTPDRIGRASIENVTEWFRAVGTVRPRTETNIEAQVTGRVVDVLVSTGEKVAKGQELIVLDRREFEARLEQARQGLRSAQSRLDQAGQATAAAKAEFDRANSEYRRYQRLLQAKTISSSQFEQAQSAFLQAQANLNRARDGMTEAQAGVRQAEQQMEEAEISSGYTSITAVDEGQVVKRLVETGDLAWPGKLLLVLQTQQSLRLEALVREGLIGHIRPGQELNVVIDALEKTISGTVEEVMPSADPQSRTFLVKAAIPASPGLYPGMFGRLLVPIEERRVVTAPAKAIRRIGQLEMVRIHENDSWRDINVLTGRVLGNGDRVEVLSGLNGDESLALWTAD